MNELSRLTLTEAQAQLQNREISATELTRSCLNQMEATEPTVAACLTVLADQALDEAAQMDKAGPDPQKSLWGLPLTLKDSYCVKGVRTTGASKILGNFTPAFDAEVVTRLKQAGAIILAKTNLDEFAMGCTTESSAFGPTHNPWNPAKIPGGSSGGAAASIAAYQTPGALGTDTGGSIRLPAALCGCVGLKPTFGRVSRYGIMALASSFDQAGPLARRVGDCARLLEAIAGPDERDNLVSPRPVPAYSQARPLPLKGLKLALPEELWNNHLSPEVAETTQAAVDRLVAAGVEIKRLSLPSLKFAPAAYHVLVTAEASTNLARFDGVHFGYRHPNPKDLDDIYYSSRSAGFGAEAKRRMIMGTFFLSIDQYESYFLKAAQVRRLVQTELNQALTESAFICAPVNSRPAWDLGLDGPEERRRLYLGDQMNLPANLAGLPALTLPIGLDPKEKLPVGLQLYAPAFGEMELLAAGLALEELFPPLL